MTPRETENNAYANFWGDKEHYGMLWYFLEWSIGVRKSLISKQSFFICIFTTLGPQ